MKIVTFVQLVKQKGIFMTLIDGKAVSEKVKQEIAAEVADIVAKEGNVLTWLQFWSDTTEGVKLMWRLR